MTRPGDARRVDALEGYAHWAATYDAVDNPLTAMAAHAVAASGIDLTGRRVLELGCGTGRNVDPLLARGIAGYVGIDASAEMLALAEARRDHHVRFERRDLRETWSTGLGRFDVVLVSLVLEHFENVHPILEPARRVVGDGGRVWILELHADLHADGVAAHVEAATETLLLPSYRHTAAELCASLAATGWHVTSHTSWFATPAHARRSPKLARYLGRPVLLEVHGGA